jgi:hypothetical protein
MFHTCGICGREFGLRDMVTLESVQHRINASGINEMWLEKTANRNNPQTSQQRRNYELAMYEELPNGILRHATYACKICVKHLPNVVPKTHVPNSFVDKIKAITVHLNAGNSPKFVINPNDAPSIKRMQQSMLDIYYKSMAEESLKRSIIFNGIKRVTKAAYTIQFYWYLYRYSFSTRAELTQHLLEKAFLRAVDVHGLQKVGLSVNLIQRTWRERNYERQCAAIVIQCAFRHHYPASSKL